MFGKIQDWSKNNKKMYSDTGKYKLILYIIAISIETLTVTSNELPIGDIVQENYIKLEVWKWKNCYQRFYGGKLFSLTPLLCKKKPRRPYLLCFMRYELGRFQNLMFHFFSQKQRVFSKNIIGTKIFHVKFSTKLVSTKFSATLTVTKLQSFECGVNENIMV